MLDAVWGLIGAADKYIVEKAPWKIAKDTAADAPARLDGVLYSCAETLRLVAGILSPILPESTQKIWAQLGYHTPISDVTLGQLHWGHLPEGQHLGMVAGIFPRAEAATTIEKMAALEKERNLKRENAVTSSSDPHVQEFKGADYFLTGTLGGLSTRTKAGTSDYILYEFQLIDARTSAIVWGDNAEIKKQGLEDAAYR